VSSLTTLIILITLIHVAAFVVMVVIRVRRNEADGPMARWYYDGLDPNQQRDPHTGRYWSTDMAHYQPLCAAH